MTALKENDVVRILTPVSGQSEVDGTAVSFPAGTEGTIVHVAAGGYIVAIDWATSEVSDDGLLASLHADQVEVVWSAAKNAS